MKARFSLLTMPLVVAASPAVAQEQARVALDVTATGGYSSNPFSQNGGSGAGYAALDVTPQIELAREHSTFTATASAHVDQYFNRYPTTDSYRASLGYVGKPSARFSTFARVDLSSSILGTYNNFAPNLDGAPAGGVAGSGLSTGTAQASGSDAGSGGLVNDVGLFGTRERRRSLYANAGFSATLSERDAVSASVFGDFARYRNFVASDYDGYGGSLSYTRRLSGYTSVGLQGSASRYAYQGPNGASNVYSAQATFATRLNDRWSLQSAAGVSFVNAGAAGSTSRTSLSGNVSLCRTSPLSNFCLSASRAARATGFNGSQYVTTVGATFDRRLSDRERIGLNANYVKEGGLQSVGSAPSQYLSVSPIYSRQVLERLRLVASARYRRIFGGTINQSSDYGGQLGVSYHLGRLR